MHGHASLGSKICACMCCMQKVRVNANLGLGFLNLVCMDPINQFMGSGGMLETLCVCHVGSRYGRSR